MSRHLSPVPDWAQGVPVTDREADQERKLLDCANILGRLQAKGWIERRDVPGDRRAKCVVPTAKAKTLQHEVAVIAQALREQLLAGIDPARVAIAAEVLSQLRQRLENLHD